MKPFGQKASQSGSPSGRFRDDLVVALQGLGKPQQTVAVEIALTGVPEHPILQDCHLAKER
jgi:hypothetical protein